MPENNEKNQNESSENVEKEEISQEAESQTESSPEPSVATPASPHKHHHTHGKEEEEFKFEKDPIFEIEYKGDCLYSAKITIPAINTQKQASKNLEELKEHAELPGFRKGKAPMWLLENKFGKLVRKEARDKVISEAVKKLVEDNKFKVFNEPHIEGLEELDKLPDDQDITYTVSIEVAPKCELGKYRGLELERKVFVPDEETIANRLETIRNRFAIYESISDGEAVEGDQVIIDFTGTIGGETFPGGSATNYPYIMGSKRFFGKFEEVLSGAKVGDTKTCEVDFPEDYSNHVLAGKKAIFEIKVKDIKRKQVPELNDEFAKQAGAESLDELKQEIKKEIEEDIANDANALLESDAIEKLIESTTFEIPKSLIDEMARNHVEEQIQHLLQMRIPMSEIEAQREEMETKARERAIKTIKWYTVANEIAEAEGIEVTEEDFEDEAQNIRGRTGIDIETIRNYIQAQGKDDVTDTIIRRKVVKIIIDNAKIEDKVVSREEWEKLLNQ